MLGCVGLLGLGGCGGDDEGQSDGETTDSFLAQVEATCKEHTDPIRAASSKLLAGGKLPKPSQFQELAERTIIPEYGAQASELQDLTPPDEIAEPYGQWLSSSKATLAQIMKDPQTLTDPASFMDVNAEADQLQLSTDCHVGPG